MVFSYTAPYQTAGCLGWMDLLSLAQRLLCPYLAQQMFSPQTSIQAEGNKKGEVPFSDDRCQGEGAISWIPVQRPESPFCLLLPFLRPGSIQLFFGFCPYISTTFLY